MPCLKQDIQNCLTGVDADVMLKGCGLSKPFITVFTNVGSLPSVRSHVTSQTCTLSEPLTAL